jgi:hypothetical protein
MEMEAEISSSKLMFACKKFWLDTHDFQEKATPLNAVGWLTKLYYVEIL